MINLANKKGGRIVFVQVPSISTLRFSTASIKEIEELGHFVQDLDEASYLDAKFWRDRNHFDISISEKFTKNISEKIKAVL